MAGSRARTLSAAAEALDDEGIDAIAAACTIAALEAYLCQLRLAIRVAAALLESIAAHGRRSRTAHG